MKRTRIQQLPHHIGERVKISGWANTIRDQGAIKFIIVRDNSGTVQVVVENNTSVGKIIKDLTVESVIEVYGELKSVSQAPNGYEIVAEQIDILSKAYSPLPIAVVEKGGSEPDQPIRLDWRFIDLRKPKNQLIMQIWTTFEKAFFDFLVEREFTEIHSPKLMSSPSESGAELFEIKYFDRKAYLSQSPQFYKQMGIASGFEKIFEIGPVFRAEPSFTTRHATEFTGYDLEMAYINSYEELIDFEEDLLVYMFSKVKEKYGQEIKDLFEINVRIPNKPFTRIKFEKAKAILNELGVESKDKYDMSPEKERAIGAYVKEKYDCDFVAITEYPIEGRPFYHMRLEDGSKFTRSYDLFYKGIEITTSAQREHRYDVLVKQAKEKGMNLDSLEYYLNFFKYGCPPHGGMGLGPARIVMKMLNQPNIREVTFLHRGVNRLKP